MCSSCYLLQYLLLVYLLFVLSQLDGEEIRHKFKTVKSLGQGSFATVQLVEDRKTAERFAMKMFQKSALSEADTHAILYEASVMRHLAGHPHIVQVPAVCARVRVCILERGCVVARCYAYLSRHNYLCCYCCYLCY